jgi:glucan biosynthesis protein C
MAEDTILRQGGERTVTPSRDTSIDYLRTTLTLMVLAHHSSLAYTTFAYFDRRDISRSTAPVVDITRWAFFDYAENFNDVFFMSLMFFLSGLFVYPALRHHGALRFIRDRFLRLGLPFAFAVAFLMPIAYYASWQLTGMDVGFPDFYKRLAESGFATGPPWFIWVLLLFDIVLALLLLPFHRYTSVAGRAMQYLHRRPVMTMGGTLLLGSIVYIPLMFRYGFGTWTNFITSPLSFQVCRFGLYAFWFVFGFLVGVPGYAKGLLSRDGPLACYWPLWVLGCIVAYNALWFIPQWPLVHQLSGSSQKTLEALLWVTSCVASCFGFLAFFRGVDLPQRAWMNSLSRSAYVMYLVHYVFITWTQRIMLDQPFHASVKFLFVFLSTTLLSWTTAQIMLRVPRLSSFI